MNRLQNMLLGIAIGDAFGAGYEFAFNNRADYQSVNPLVYRAHQNPEFRHVPGKYTDDAQMSIAVAELLASDKMFNHPNLAESFVRTYKRDPSVGYAKNFQAFLDSINTGNQFITKIKPDSERNGAAMRSVPIGIVHDLEKVVKYARTNAELTHDTPKGIDSSIAVAVLSHYAFYEHRLPSMPELFRQIGDFDTRVYISAVSKMKELDPELLFGEKNKDKGVPCDGMRTVGAVLYILSRHARPLDVLVESVKLGGDTDSVASIALGIKMLNHDVSELPVELVEGLTNHAYGRDFLVSLGSKLADKFC